MAEISVEVGGRSYQVACRDGGEDQLRKVAAMVDERAGRISSAVGNLTENRQLLMVAMVLADELSDARKEIAAQAEIQPIAPPESDNSEQVAAIDQLTARVESLTRQLEELADIS